MTELRRQFIVGVDYESGNSGVDAVTESLQTVAYEHHEIHSNSHYFVRGYVPEGSFDATDVVDFGFYTDDSTKLVHLLFSYATRGEVIIQVYEGATVTADTGSLIVQRGSNRAKTFIGSHTNVASSATVMTDSNASFTVDALIGWKIYNITDGSYGIITDNDATTVTVASLTGGTNNDWDQDDEYEINRSLSQLKSGPTITDTGQLIWSGSVGDSTNPTTGVPGSSGRSSEVILRQGTWYIFRFTSGVNNNVLSYDAEWYEHTDKN